MKFRLFLYLALLVSTNVFSQSKEDFSDDWAALSKYKVENELLPQAKKHEKRVVFLGSSIFEFWKQKDSTFFKVNPYLDRGISGQISPQLLLRFRQDVINLNPKAVIILAGSNDISGDRGHVSITKIMDNIKMMAELAKLHHIKVILCKYLPIYEYPWDKNLENVPEKIADLNNRISLYAQKNHFTILDYFTPLVDERGGQKADLTTDGVHPNLAGYKIMEEVTQIAIKKAFKSRF